MFTVVFTVIAILMGLVFISVRSLRSWSWAPLVTAVLIFVGGIFTAVSTGHVGVVRTFGKVSEDRQLSEGLNVILPWQSVTEKSVQTVNIEQHGENAIDVLSSDALKMPTDVSLVARMAPASAACIVQRMQEGRWAPTLIQILRASVRDVGAKYTGRDLIGDKRAQFGAGIRKATEDKMAGILENIGCGKSSIVIEQIQVRKIALPEKIQNAIDEKLEAQEQAERMAFVLQRETQEAKRKEIEAIGIQRFQDIVRKGIDEHLLRWKGIEATQDLAKSPNSKIIVIGGKDGLPLILNADAAR